MINSISVLDFEGFKIFYREQKQCLKNDYYVIIILIMLAFKYILMYTV